MAGVLKPQCFLALFFSVHSVQPPVAHGRTVAHEGLVWVMKQVVHSWPTFCGVGAIGPGGSIMELER